MGNCDSSCIAKVGTSRSSTKGTHVRGGRGGVRHKRIKSEHKHQGPIYWKFHEKTSALEYYEPIRSIGEGSIGSIHLVRRRPERISVPYQECLEIIIDGDRTDHPECSSTSSSEDGTDGPENEKETSQDQEELFVLKSILKDHLQDDDCLNEMRSEIHNMKYLDHPHIAKVYEAFEKKRMVWMVMENLSGGDLRSRMPYTEAEVADAIRDVLSAVVYLHSKNVVHRDLKLENIMFEDDSPTATASVKLIDFGLSTKYLSNEYKYMRERVGTVYTMSPQVVQGRYDKSCDLWSVGVITYILLSGGELPFPGKNRAQIVKMIMQCKFSFHGKQWSNVSKEAKDFITSLLQMDPLDRPRADAALKSNWMKKQFPPGAPNPKLQPSDRLDARQRIHEYGKETKLKRLALLFLAHKSTTSEIAKMRELFEEIDEDGNGEISLAELRRVLGGEDSNLSAAEVKKIFKGVDADANNSINYNEFLAATLETTGRIETHRLRDVFDRLDTSRSGTITRDDLKTILSNEGKYKGKKGKLLLDEEVEDIFAELGKENDESIKFREFVQLFDKRRRTLAGSMRACTRRRVLEESDDDDDDYFENAIIPGGVYSFESCHTTPSTYMYDKNTKALHKVGSLIGS